MVRPAARMLSLCLVLILGACASLDDALPPEVGLADIKFLGSGLLEQQVQVDLSVRNPNNFDLPLEGMSFDLILNGSRFAKGFTNESATIPRLGEARIPVVASTSFLDVAQQLLALARGGGNLDYEINGLAYLGGITTRTVPYDKSGNLRLLDLGDSDTETLVPL